MTINKKGVKFVHDGTRPLNIYSMDDAQDVIARAIEKGPPGSTTPLQWARHLAWLIGFDTLIDERKSIHSVTSLIVADE